MPVGRPAGSENANRRALRARIHDLWPEWDPVVQMAESAIELKELAKQDDTRLMDSVNAADKVAAYLTPKLKAVEVTGAGGGPIQVAQYAAADDSL